MEKWIDRWMDEWVHRYLVLIKKYPSSQGSISRKELRILGWRGHWVWRASQKK